MKVFASLLLSLIACAASAQHLVQQEVFDAIAGEYSGEAARENTRRIVEYHRIQGSPMMASVAEQVVLPRLKAAGLEARIEQFVSDGKTRYGTYVSPMGWDMRGGELWVESAAGVKDFKPVRLCRYSDVPMCVSTFSKGGDWSGELVDVGDGTSPASYQGKDVRGKVALASGYARAVVRQAVLKHGALGVVIYPAAQDRPDHPDMVRYNGIWPTAEELEKTSSGFQISRNQYDQIKALMAQGAVRVHGHIDATLGPGKLTLVHAWIRGTERPAREVLFTGHLDHPKWSANDNASGSGAMMEAARALSALIAAKKIPAPRFTIHFMWVPEYLGTLAYVSHHPELKRCPAWDDAADQRSGDQAPCIIANINTDMVGEDTVKTGSRFYFTRTPDSVPSFLDGLMNDLVQQTREADLYAVAGTRNYWPTEAIAYAQGSDHDVFLGLGIPSTMLGHDPDWTHHTSEDRIENTDASELLRVGTLASAAAYWMAHAGLAEWRQIDAAQQAMDAAERARRVAVDLAGMMAGAAGRIQRNTAALQRVVARLEADGPNMAHPQRAQLTVGGPAGPVRLMIQPLDDAVFAGLDADDQKWIAQQSERFFSNEEGLARNPNFALISFEAINYMNGHRTTAEIADLLSDEYLADIDQAWVDRLVGILEKQKIVAPK